MLARLLSKCQNISSSIARLVDAVREEKVCSMWFVELEKSVSCFVVGIMERDPWQLSFLVTVLRLDV